MTSIKKSNLSQFDILKAKPSANDGANKTRLTIVQSGLKLDYSFKDITHKTGVSITPSVVKKYADVYTEVIKKGLLGRIKDWVMSNFFGSKFVRHEFSASSSSDKSSNIKAVYLNINSFVKRTGLTKARISDPLDKFQSAAKVDLLFQKYLSNPDLSFGYDSVNTVSMEMPCGKEVSVRKLRNAFVDSVGSMNTDKTSLNITECPDIKGKKFKVVAQREKENDFPKFSILAQKLGSGSFGSVFLAEDFGKKELGVCKLADVDSDDKRDLIDAMRDIKNEYEILNSIFEDNPNTSGIQRPPYRLLSNAGGSSERAQGYLAPKYDCDLSDALSSFEGLAILSDTDRIDAARQLLKGLLNLQENGVVHGDIKPANCLIRKKGAEALECVIADFGDAANLKTKIKNPSVYTPGYVVLSEYRELASLALKHISYTAKNLSENVLSGVRQRFENLAYKRDVYAMGETLRRVFRGFKGERAVKIEELIKKMTYDDCRFRCEAASALSLFNGIFPTGTEV